MGRTHWWRRAFAATVLSSAACSLPTTYGLRTDGLMGPPLAVEANLGAAALTGLGAGPGSGFGSEPKISRVLGVFAGSQVVVTPDVAVSAAIYRGVNPGPGVGAEAELRLRVMDEAMSGVNLTLLAGGGTWDFESYWGAHVGAVAALRTGSEMTVYFGGKANPVFQPGEPALFGQLIGGVLWRPRVGESTSLVFGAEVFAWDNLLPANDGAGAALAVYCGVRFGDTRRE